MVSVNTWAREPGLAGGSALKYVGWGGGELRANQMVNCTCTGRHETNEEEEGLKD